MMKDKEWLKEKIVDLFHTACQIGKVEYYEADQSVHVINELIDQLDEPEVLSKEWIDEHAQGGCDEWVYTEDLENLLVPKQELPVIPRWVADWIESYREKLLVELLYDAVYSSSEEISAFRRWFHDEMGFESNYSEFLSRAWLDGYEVEREKKYYVLDSLDIPLLERANNQTYKTTTTLSIYEDGRDNSKFELTEQEIKDYDERYWAFAQEVTE